MSTTASPIPPPSSHVAPTEGDFARAFRATPHRYFDLGHSRVAYYRFGRGPDVFFVHGWPLDAATFRRILPVLAASFTCHLVDLPGVGQTDSDDDAPIDFVGHAASVRAVVDALGLERYALVAHDSGGFVARLVAAEDPRVTRLVLGNTEVPGHTPPLVVAFALLAKTPFATAVIRRVLASTVLRRSALGFGGAFEDAAYVDGPFFDLFIAPLLHSEQAARGQLRLLESVGKGVFASMLDVHARIRVPVKLLWGTRDPFFPLSRARAMVSTFGGPASLHEIAGAKVFPHEDHAEEFAVETKAFLSA